MKFYPIPPGDILRSCGHTETVKCSFIQAFQVMWDICFFPIAIYGVDPLRLPPKCEQVFKIRTLRCAHRCVNSP